MKTSSKTSLFLAAAAFTTFTACGQGPGGFAGALPSDDNVSIRVPGSSASNALEAEQPLLGESSDFYVQTYRISRFLNGHVVGLLRNIRQVTRQQPTSVEGTKRIWGPHTPGGLEPLTYRLIVDEVGENLYALDLQGRPRASQDEADFKSIIDGQFEGSGQGDGRAKGDLVLHFDNAGEMNPAVLERGEIAINFNALEEPRTIAIDFIQFAGAEGQPHDGTYRYSENADRSGTFLFSVLANIHKANESRPGLETMALRSSWTASGAGRGDVTITGEEVDAQLTEHNLATGGVQATECWGEDFTVVFQDTIPEVLREEIRPLQGDASACAVENAVYPETI